MNSVKKRINIDISTDGCNEHEMLKFIANWKGMDLKPYIESVLSKHIIDQANKHTHFKDYYDVKNNNCR